MASIAAVTLASRRRRWDAGQCQQHLGGAPCTRHAFVGGTAEARASRARGEVVDRAVAGDCRRLPGDDPGDALVIAQAEPDERPQDIAVEAVDDGRRRAASWSPFRRACRCPHRGLRMLEQVLAAAAHPLIGPVGTHLVEEDERPDGAPILGTVSGAQHHPPALGVLGVEERRDRIAGHGSGTLGSHGRGIVVGIEQALQREVPNRVVLVLEQPRQRIGLERCLPCCRHHPPPCMRDSAMLDPRPSLGKQRHRRGQVADEPWVRLGQVADMPWMGRSHELAASISVWPVTRSAQSEQSGKRGSSSRTSVASCAWHA